MTLRKKPCENIVEKEQNTFYQYFLLFPQFFLPFPQNKINLFSHIYFDVCKSSQIGRVLTLSQTTNFRLFRTERVYRQLFKFNKKFLLTVRKHGGKRRICSFSNSVFKRLYSRQVKTRACSGKG